jgi:hypothetical protein
MIENTTLMPFSFWGRYLEVLQRGHARVTSMKNRAMQTIYSDNMMIDIENPRGNCEYIRKRVRHQEEPPVEPKKGKEPFHSISADFFMIEINITRLLETGSQDGCKHMNAALEEHPKMVIKW